MSTFKLATVVALAAVLASTSLVEAGGFLPKQTVRTDGSGQGSGNGNSFFPQQFNRSPQTGGPGDQGGPDNNKPAPEFGDSDVTDVKGPTVKLSPDSMSCIYKGDHLPDGTPEVWLKNVSDQTIPKGTIVVVIWPDGTKEYFALPWDLEPGGSVGSPGPAGADQPGFHCKVRARLIVG